MALSIGQVIDGTVTGIQPYGAFVSLSGDLQGLVHISEVKHGYIKSVTDVLAIGEKVKVKVIDIDEYSQKVSLSLRTLDPKAPAQAFTRKKYFTNPKKKIGFATLDKQMPLWISASMEELVGK